MTKNTLLPEPKRDEQARQEFVLALRGHLAGQVMPGNFALYRQRVEPAFEESAGRAPESIKEVRELMTSQPYYQFWSAMQRRSQELMWDSVIDPVERELDALNERTQSIMDRGSAGGSLRLNADLEIPRYHTAADIHLQPGGYHTEFTDNDAAAGAIYDTALPIYIGGAMGTDNDMLGRVLAQFLKDRDAEFEPGKILDIGCAIGNSTLPWADAYPGAELHAIDVAAPCLRYAHARAEMKGVPVHFAQQNAESTDYDDESFDLVVSHIVLHETSRSALHNIFAECRRLLRPGGWMLHLEIPRGKDPFEQFMFQWEAYNNNETFAGFMTRINLVDVAVGSGFEANKIALEPAYPIMKQQHKNYTTERFFWPVLAGQK